jgi:hypothetical protein
MSRKTTDEIEFEKINLAIDQLLKKLRNVCPCCVSQGLMWRAAFLHQQVVGSEETIELCHDIATLIEHSDELPVGSTQH